MKKYTEQEIKGMGFVPAQQEYFTGKAWLKTYVFLMIQQMLMLVKCYLRPGTRNNWHTHGSNQILLIREGVCFYQEEGQPVQKISVGGYVNIMPGIRHWHGASPDGVMIHTAIGINAEKGLVNWEEPVADEDYNSAG
jgi:quercetin dioxygenase-like cupin family protein